GHGAALEAVKPFLKAKSHQEQAAAVDAIRLMQHPEVDLILASSLSAPHSNVQVAALDALAVRPPSDALATALARLAASGGGACHRRSRRARAGRETGISARRAETVSLAPPRRCDRPTRDDRERAGASPDTRAGTLRRWR